MNSFPRNSNGQMSSEEKLDEILKLVCQIAPGSSYNSKPETFESSVFSIRKIGAYFSLEMKLAEDANFKRDVVS